MTTNNECLTETQIATLARKLFGPEEEWDDTQAEFVVRLYEVNADGPDITMKNRLGYQVVDANGEMPDGWVSFGIYKLAICRQVIKTDKSRWRLVTIFEGDIEEPTFINE